MKKKPLICPNRWNFLPIISFKKKCVKTKKKTHIINRYKNQYIPLPFESKCQQHKVEEFTVLEASN